MAMFLVALPLLPGAHVARAAASAGCEGGGFTLVFAGRSVSGKQKGTLAASALGTTFTVRGKYVQFVVVSSTFGIRNYLLTGASNPLDITGGLRTVIFAAKTPIHRGLTLSGDLQFELKDTDVVLKRSGTGLKMKIQAKDCAQGGVFQMEPERDDATATVITHLLAPTTFYFDNPNFRAREGDSLPYKDTTVTVSPRVNFGNAISAKFVGRDSPQVATRLPQGCPNQIRKRDGSFATVDHCGGISKWRVASGGRMGMVLGEDATEVAPPAMDCVEDCQAQNQVRGQAVVLGFPFPVPVANRLTPRIPAP